ncbi:hypothetical protein HWV23_16835 [Natronomonas halophila]|uniref:hypothetical protein n=1 Tax=Natronomonas halophila TaxID=2747817 RepID=UPI0015B57D5E|nr:hypothetical protein [Natronomonas halophila]QLD87317.1 hypothetical protein HWV23_16835 [Natronomonas halophila]
MSDDEGDAQSDHQQKQLRRIGYGIVVSGVLTYLVTYFSSRPYEILVFGLAGLAVALLVFEKIEGGGMGVSLGLLTGSFGVWLWPQVEGGNFYVLGYMLILAGLANVLLMPYFRDIGERLAGGRE